MSVTWEEVGDVRLACGESLAVLPTIPDASADAVITDPPYSSGGQFRGDRTASTDAKYSQSTSLGMRADFGGDTRDQRAWLYWCSLWMSECLRIVKPSGYLLSFVDWRQLPQMTDAIQCGGWVYRGIIVWDKGAGARAAHPGLFRHQCEYVAWATAGVSKSDGHDGPWNGCFHFPVKQDDKHHQTGKPSPLMRELVKCCPRGGTVLDPFAGSGTTLKAAMQTGRKAIGIEQDRGHFATALARLRACHGVGSLFDPGRTGVER